MRPFKTNSPVVIDYETSGLHPYKGHKIFAAVLTWPTDGYCEVYQRAKAFDRVVELWDRYDVPKIAQNMKFELGFTEYDLDIRVDPRTVLHDTMIMGQLIDNLAPHHSLDYMTMKYVGYNKEWEDADREIDKANKIYGSYDKIPWPQMFRYIKFDGIREALLYMGLYPVIQANPKLLAEYQVEMELIRATQKFEQRGIMIDRGKTKKLIDWMEKEIEESTVPGLNLNSGKQVARLLFTELGLPVVARTATGQPKTDKDALEALRLSCDNPILDKILKMRSYSRGITDLQKYLDIAGDDDIIHPNINTNKARTGRQSSSDPNLQNISKAEASKVRFPVPARQCFRARPGYVMVLGDYAGVEMRVGVQGTGSPRLIKLTEENFDWHTATAKSFYKNFAGEKKLRGQAKNARFAMFYGAGLAKVAATLGLSIEETREGYIRDRKEFPELYTFMDECTHKAKETGGIETFFGRFLRVPHETPYAATDYIIQGSSAALFKRAQIKVAKYLEPYDASILLPVHDELVMEFHRSLLSKLPSMLRDISKLMTEHKEITVPLKVEWRLSTYLWADAKEYTI